MKKTTLVLAALMTLSATVASAQATRPADQEFVFTEGAEVAGTVATPVIEILTVPRLDARHSLIRIRTQFVTELERSAADL